MKPSFPNPGLILFLTGEQKFRYVSTGRKPQKRQILQIYFLKTKEKVKKVLHFQPCLEVWGRGHSKLKQCLPSGEELTSQSW